ncbi:sigma factor-like helix-turn-helix DNA-binding protein [uncultured Campylobacter sp.]|uniref:sigma factor-like helix-turn-helix DNA-binding protein n=2 Tax=uncultured Campylobacter sp. TaxID=218934 RepID=UPI002609422A|nr:sigma factor-like helix-turn-helix DNA-binding protein [uncultured Campylobacter sp.]
MKRRKMSLALSKRESASALKDDADASYKELAAIFGISVQRVAMIERAALAKLRHPKNRKAWIAIFETLAEIEKCRAQRLGSGWTLKGTKS